MLNSDSQMIEAADALKTEKQLPIFDVRSPSEFQKGHIPGAYNLPLFSNREREIVGTLYQQCGKDAAMLKGLDIVGPGMRKLVEGVSSVTDQQTLLVHCWRGGLRSQSVAWLLSLFGYRIYLLNGGYKAFRQFVLNCFEIDKPIYILGGYTGSGKSQILAHLKQMGQPTIDLEKLAHHSGSAFGSLGKSLPPSQEQFENELAIEWFRTDPTQPVWIEDESKKIGARVIPVHFWTRMRLSPVFFLEIPLELRIQQLVDDYGSYRKNDLKNAILRLKKRLGGLNTTQALQALEADDLHCCCRILLYAYYDKMYTFGLSKRKGIEIYRLKSACTDPAANGRLLLEQLKKIPHMESIQF